MGMTEEERFRFGDRRIRFSAIVSRMIEFTLDGTGRL